MKKRIFISILLFCVLGINAQNIVNLGDSNTGYIIPQFAQSYGLFEPVQMVSDSRWGNNFQIQTTGTKIYGVACLLYDSIVSDSGYYAFFLP